MNTSSNPYQSPTAGLDDGLDAKGELSLLAPLVRSAGWTKFIGIMFIIAGAFSILSIWGIIFAWLPIWMGILLIQFSGLIRNGHGDKDPQKCRASLDKLRLFFKIFGIVMIIYACLVPVAIIAAIAIPNLIAARGH